jgi:hypothetical protein
MAIIPNDPETRLRRDAAAAALTALGFTTSPKTLSTLASRTRPVKAALRGGLAPVQRTVFAPVLVTDDGEG